MAPISRGLEFALAALILLATGGVARAQETAPQPLPAEAPPDSRPELAVMGTIPIYWGEAADVAELIGGAYQPHWARNRLEQDWRLAPLDFLSRAALAGHQRLLLAQPRGLAPEENVALDEWVRAGGQVLLFADPMMTGDSRFALGDRRRAQDVALLSPILARWGLDLVFDDAQAAGITVREIAGGALPVNLPGQFLLRDDGAAHCTSGTDAILARCEVGKGSVVLLADAALLDVAGPWDGAPEALDRLAELAFGQNGEITGEEPVASPGSF